MTAEQVAAAILAELATAAPRKPLTAGQVAAEDYWESVAEDRAANPTHPMYDDADQAAAYAYREEVSSA